MPPEPPFPFSPRASCLPAPETVTNRRTPGSRIRSFYGDGPPRGEGVYQARALARGAEYFDAEFPELDRIERATIL